MTWPYMSRSSAAGRSDSREAWALTCKDVHRRE
jgi:hypothetical protein